MLQKHGSIEKNVTDGRGHAAYVINNNDPKKWKRLQIRVPLIHRGIVDADLPWALCVSADSPSGDNGQVGSIRIPAIGSLVWIEFQDDSAYHPVWYGTIGSGITVPSALTATNYPNQDTYIDICGNLWVMDAVAKTVAFTHISGTTFNIAANGTVTVISAQDLNLEAVGNINLQSGTSINIDSATVNLKSNQFNENVSGPTGAPTVTPRSTPAAVNVAGLTTL